MKTNNKTNTSEIRAEQAANAASYDAVYLGVDLHKESISVTRIIDHGTAQPAQRFTWEAFWKWVQKQIPLARKVHVVYEAGAFGFWVCRKLKELGADCFVVHPEKLDPRHKRVQTDKTDSRHLADRLQRYVLGNKMAMVPVYVPSLAEEEGRIEARHRRALSRQLQSLRARGRGLLLSQGVFQTKSWWTPLVWAQRKLKVCAPLQAALEDLRALMQTIEKQLAAVEKKLETSAPKGLPRGFGRLTFVLLLRELCNYKRFPNRRKLGGFTGLCGAVSSSGPYHLDMGINKAGSPYIRTLLIELAWRMVHYQPKYRGLKRWKLLRQRGHLRNRRQRKIALVALARQLAVDVWRWQTGQVNAQALGWEMNTA